MVHEGFIPAYTRVLLHVQILQSFFVFIVYMFFVSFMSVVCSSCFWKFETPILIIASFFGSIFFIFKERMKPRLILGQSHGLVSQSNGLHQSHGLFPYSPKCKHRILLFCSNLRLRVKNTFHILREIT